MVSKNPIFQKKGQNDHFRVKMFRLLYYRQNFSMKNLIQFGKFLNFNLEPIFQSNIDGAFQKTEKGQHNPQDDC